MKSITNHTSVRVYYEDTDCGNVVYYANYLKYMERGRAELMRQLGLGVADLHEQDTLFVVAEASIKYHKSARHDDLLDVATKIIEHSSVSLVFFHEITNQNRSVCVSGTTKAACVNKLGKLKKIPEMVLTIIEA